MTESVWAVVVARTGQSAKTRLAEKLTAEERSALASAMVADVLRAVVRAELAGTVSVLEPSGAPAEGVAAIADPGADLNAAVTSGVRAAIGRGATTVVVLAGDLPLLEANDIATLLAAAEGTRVVVVATDRHGTGTNALVLRPADVIEPAFGPDSRARHMAAAAAAGAAARSLELERIALDIDTPDDLARLKKRQRAGATGAVLRSMPT